MIKCLFWSSFIRKVLFVFGIAQERLGTIVIPKMEEKGYLKKNNLYFFELHTRLVNSKPVFIFLPKVHRIDSFTGYKQSTYNVSITYTSG